MKRFLLASLLFASTGATASVCSADLLLEGTAAATKSAAQRLDKVLSEQLRRCLADESAHSRERALAAYLLTFAEDFDGFRWDDPALAYLAENGTPEDLLGKEAAQRFYRLRGDQAYENAKFDAAEAAYRTLITITEGDVREYGLLKLGWTLMNKNRPQDAFDLWAKEATAANDAKKASSPNLLHGLAQAFVETNKGDKTQAALLEKLAQNDDAREALTRGVLDGLPSISKATDLEKLGDALGNGKLYASVVHDVAERFGGTARTCPLLSLIAHPTPIAAAQPLIDGCRTRIEKYADERKLFEPSRLANVIVQGDERQKTFALLRIAKRPDLACREAVAWLEESANAAATAKSTLAIAPKDAAQQCRLALDASQDEKKKASEELAASMDKVFASAIAKAPASLSDLRDPRYFVTVQLLDHRAFGKAFSAVVLTHAEQYRATQIPAILAERAQAADDDAAAEALFTAFGGLQTTGKPVEVAVADKSAKAEAAPDSQRNAGVPSMARGGGSVWDAILVKKASKLVDDGKSEEALAFLAKEAPAKQVAPGSVLSRLWLKATLSAAAGNGKAAAEPYASDVADLARRSKENRDHVAGLELLARYDRWQEVAVGLESLGPAQDAAAFSDRFLDGLFGAIVAKTLVIPATAKISGPELRFVILSAQSLVEKGTPVAAEKTKGKGTSKSAVVTELHYLDGLGKRAEVAAKTGGDATKTVSRWVDFLDRSQREYRKTAWVHPLLAQSAVKTVEGFCGSRAAELPKLKRPSQLAADEWSAVTQALGDQLNECVRWAQSQAEPKKGAGS